MPDTNQKKLTGRLSAIDGLSAVAIGFDSDDFKNLNGVTEELNRVFEDKRYKMFLIIVEGTKGTVINVTPTPHNNQVGKGLIIEIKCGQGKGEHYQFPNEYLLQTIKDRFYFVHIQDGQVQYAELPSCPQSEQLLKAVHEFLCHP